MVGHILKFLVSIDNDEWGHKAPSFNFLLSGLSQITGLEVTFKIALLECQTLLKVYFLSVVSIVILEL